MLKLTGANPNDTALSFMPYPTPICSRLMSGVVLNRPYEATPNATPGTISPFIGNEGLTSTSPRANNLGFHRLKCACGNSCLVSADVILTSYSLLSTLTLNRL